MIDHAALIAIILAGIVLAVLVYMALFMPPDGKPRPRDGVRKAKHYQRWEDRL